MVAKLKRKTDDFTNPLDWKFLHFCLLLSYKIFSSLYSYWDSELQQLNLNVMGSQSIDQQARGEKKLYRKKWQESVPKLSKEINI